jgi:hypothetical protein
MSLLNGSGAKAREVLDFCLSSESPTVRSKVYEIVNSSGLEPDDPLFLVLALTGQMRVFLEAAPEQLNQLLSEWKNQSASSLSEISSAVSLIKQTQQEQADVIQAELSTVSQQCVSDIKGAGMATVSAIADAHSETWSQAQRTQRQNEELLEEIKVLHAEVTRDQRQTLENKKAFAKFVGKTTKELSLAHKQIDSSHSELSQLQLKTHWLKFADWYSPLSALVIVGGACFMAGGWLTFQKYNGAIDQLGRNIATWNLKQIVECQRQKKTTCNVLIVNPDSP